MGRSTTLPRMQSWHMKVWVGFSTLFPNDEATYPLKFDGWKMIIRFEMVPLEGTSFIVGGGVRRKGSTQTQHRPVWLSNPHVPPKDDKEIKEEAPRFGEIGVL